MIFGFVQKWRMRAPSFFAMRITVAKWDCKSLDFRAPSSWTDPNIAMEEASQHMGHVGMEI
jgi:hypothetical protein